MNIRAAALAIGLAVSATTGYAQPYYDYDQQLRQQQQIINQQQQIDQLQNQMRQQQQAQPNPLLAPPMFWSPTPQPARNCTIFGCY